MADRGAAQFGLGGDYVVYDPLLFGAITQNPTTLFGLEGIERTRQPLDLEALARMPFDERLRAMMALATPWIMRLYPAMGNIAGRMAVGLPTRLRDLIPLGATAAVSSVPTPKE